MKQTEKFEIPDIEIIEFSEQDVITTSGADPIGGNGNIRLPDDEW